MTTVPHNSPAHAGLEASAAAGMPALEVAAAAAAGPVDQWATIRHKLAEYRAEGKGDPRLLAHPKKDDKEAQEEEEEAKSKGSR